MAFPSIDPSEVGWTGLIWLFISYGGILYYSSGLISEGSDLLMLVPSMAGLVGGVVIPLLGAVPDGAIIAFSGLGALEEAQAQLDVGVGALAGSTIMLLTVSFALSIFGGRVDLDADGIPKYNGKPKLTKKSSYGAELTQTGVIVSAAVRKSAWLMVFTTTPYFVIQISATIFESRNEDALQVGVSEKWWSLGSLIICILGLANYMRLQLKMSHEGEDKNKRIAVMKKLLKEGKVSLAGALKAFIMESAMSNVDTSVYQAINEDEVPEPSPDALAYLDEVLKGAFLAYDQDRSNVLERKEVFTFFRDFNEKIDEGEMEKLFQHFDKDNNGTVDYKEFIRMTYTIVVRNDKNSKGTMIEVQEQATAVLEEGEEEEDIPEQFTDLSPEEQQSAIKKKAGWMLLIGTIMVVVFSDPMVEVLSELATRLNINAFYVSFVLAPLASNASEIVSAMYFSQKKTNKTITVALSTLEGAACMNNTFCLAIFMSLIFFRGLAWEYSAETISIVLVQFIMAAFAQKRVLSLRDGVFILSIFPLSIVLVYVLEAIGLD